MLNKLNTRQTNFCITRNFKNNFTNLTAMTYAENSLKIIYERQAHNWNKNMKSKNYVHKYI